jgi:hypothetical protein
LVRESGTEGRLVLGWAPEAPDGDSVDGVAGEAEEDTDAEEDLRVQLIRRGVGGCLSDAILGGDHSDQIKGKR